MGDEDPSPKSPEEELEDARCEALDSIRRGHPLYSLPERWRSDKEVVLGAITREGAFCVDYIGSRELRENDRDVALALVRCDGSLLERMSEAIRADRLVVLTAVRTFADSLQFASKQLQADKELKTIANNRRKEEKRLIKQFADKVCAPM